MPVAVYDGGSSNYELDPHESEWQMRAPFPTNISQGSLHLVAKLNPGRSTPYFGVLTPKQPPTTSGGRVPEAASPGG